MTIQLPRPGVGPESGSSGEDRFDVDPLDLLARAGELLGASLDLEQTLGDVARFCVPELADWCAIDVLDQDGPLPRVALVHAAESLQGVADEVRRSHLAHPAGHPVILRILESGRAELHPVVSDADLAREAVDARLYGLVRELGLRSVMFVPLLARGRALGVLTLVAGPSGRRYAPQDLTLAEELGRRIALALDNARLYAEAQAARAQAEASQHRVGFLAEVSAALAASLDYRTTLQAVARLAVPILAEACIVAMLEEDGTVRRVANVHVDPEKEALIRGLGDMVRYDPHGAHPIPTALRTGRTVVVDAMPDDVLVKIARDPEHLAVLRTLQYTATLTVPLVARGRRLGAVLLAVADPHRRYGAEEVELAQELARRAALAIDNARLYRDAQAAAEALRRSEASFRLLFETNPLAMLVFDTSTLEVLEVNAAAVEQYGYSRAEFLARRITDVWMPEDVQLRAAFATSDVSPRCFNPAVSRHRGKDGRILDVRVMSHRLRFAGREARLLTVQNVGEQLRAEERLRESDETLKRALAAARMGTFDWDIRTDRVIRSPGHEALFGLPPGAMAPSRAAFLERVHPDDRELIRVGLDGGPDQQVTQDHEFRVIWPDGSIHWLARRSTVFFDAAGRPTRMVGTTMDVTDRRRAEHEREQLLAERQREAEHLRVLHQQLQRSIDALLGLHEVGQVLNATRDIDRMGARLLEIARRAASLDAVVISRVAESGGLRLWKRSAPETLWRPARRSAEARRARLDVLSTGVARSYEIRPRDGCPSGLRGWCVPLKQGERVVGLIEAFASPGPDFGATAEILGSIAHQLATAMQNARLYGDLAASERDLHELVGRLMRAQEEERRRLALEVHDSLAQLATSAQMHLEAFAHQCPPLTEAARIKLETTVSLTQQTVAEIRRVLGGLRPQLLDDYGLAHALAVYVERLQEDGWDVTYREGLGAERLPRDVETALFRLAQEALTNVAKHAATRHVRIELDREERGVRLEVRDRGRGFEPCTAQSAARPGERLGLLGMRERISLIRGHCEIVSRPGEGTRVVVRVPIAGRAARDRTPP